ncbi:MAG TPA: isochorismatase family protein [Thermoanaerobaculia bacterium]|nr:isochorismatase family protein [Thermoanaerobaculia bacterium]
MDRLVQSYRAAGLPVIFVLHTDPDPEFATDSPYFKLMDFLVRRDDEPLLIKNTRNAFTSTNLQELLWEKRVERLVITGIQTEQCCETTTRLAADLGYDVDFVTEATMTFPIADPDTGDELTTDEILRRTEFVLRRRFARIATVDGLAAELAKARRESGNLVMMKRAVSTILDDSGRLVLPESIREEAGIQPGRSVEITVQDGRIEIEPTAQKVRIVRKGPLRVAVPVQPVEPLSEATVRRVRRETVLSRA